MVKFKPTLEVDRRCDAAYLKVSKKKVHETEIKKNGIIVDYDRNGWLVGIEFLNLSDLTEILKSMEVKES